WGRAGKQPSAQNANAAIRLRTFDPGISSSGGLSSLYRDPSEKRTPPARQKKKGPGGFTRPGLCQGVVRGKLFNGPSLVSAPGPSRSPAVLRSCRFSLALPSAESPAPGAAPASTNSRPRGERSDSALACL